MYSPFSYRLLSVQSSSLSYSLSGLVWSGLVWSGLAGRITPPTTKGKGSRKGREGKGAVFPLRSSPLLHQERTKHKTQNNGANSILLLLICYVMPQPSNSTSNSNPLTN